MLTLFKKRQENNLIIQSQSHNGFIREDALLKMANSRKTCYLPYVILRLNDWVPNVRHTAKHVFTSYLSKKNLQAIIINLPVLYHLRVCQRDNHQEIIEKVSLFITRNLDKNEVVNIIDSYSPKIIRILINIYSEHAMLTDFGLVIRLLISPHVDIRNKGAILIRHLQGSEKQQAIELAIKDPYMPVRREAFQLLLKNNSLNGIVVAKQFLFDKHASIREIAIKKLTEKNIPAYTLYEKALRDDYSPALKIKCALWATVVFKKTSQADRVKKYIEHPLASIRKRALKSLIQLEPEKAYPFILRALQDRSKSMVKGCIKQLERHEIFISLKDSLRVSKASPLFEDLELCFCFAKIYSNWNKLLFILELTLHHQFEDIVTLNDFFTQWELLYNYPYLKPTHLHLTKFKELYGKNHRLLDRDFPTLKKVAKNHLF